MLSSFPRRALSSSYTYCGSIYVYIYNFLHRVHDRIDERRTVVQTGNCAVVQLIENQRREYIMEEKNLFETEISSHLAIIAKRKKKKKTKSISIKPPAHSIDCNIIRH